MLPWKWVLPVWYALMHVGPTVRFGGVDELRQVAFENGVGCFPDDFPGTEAGRKEEERKGVERREWWEKRPKGKRVEWGSVPVGGKKGEIGDGFLCDWAWLMKEVPKEDVGGAVEGVVAESTMESTAETIGMSAVGGDSMDIDPPPTVEPTTDPSTSTTNPPTVPPPLLELPPIWNIPAALISALLASPHKPPPILTSIPTSTLSRGIFTIKLTFIHRGTASDRARIYRLPTDPELKAKWQALLPNTKSKGVKQRPKAGSEEYPSVPGEEECIGFVTTGNFNLKEGVSVGVGALGYRRVFGAGKAVGRVVVVRDVGTGLGRLARWEVV